MSINQDELAQIVQESCTELFKEQPMLFKAANNINERTISGELSSVFHGRFGDYNVNCEYNKMTDEYGNQIPKRIHLDPNDPMPSLVYPDIIVHRQEDSKNNLLIIEIKMTWKNDEREWDEKKLLRYIQELGYKYGLYLELGESKIVEMKWFT